MSLYTTQKITGLALLFALASCGGNKQGGAAAGMPDPNAPIPVTDTVVGYSNADFSDQFPGSVTAFQQVSLTPQVTGYVTGIHFKDGQRVTKGQLLYTIDDQVYSANLGNADANIAVQQAAVDKAQKDYDRYHMLDKEDAVAKQQVDYADAALQSAKKQLAAAKASASGVRSNVRFTKIYAPFSGTLGISQVRIGMAVFAGQTVMNTISTNNPIAVDFNVDQINVNRFIALQQSKSSIFQIRVGGDSIYQAKGFVSMIDRAADMQTGTVKVRLSFPNDKDQLKPGMNATVLVGDQKKALLIPTKAIVAQLGEFYVYVIGDSSKVTQSKLKLGNTSGVYTAVESGLKDGDKIVVDGTQNLREGSKVINQKDMAQKQAAQGGAQQAGGKK
ncbi:MAG: efflux RND transporter periplasmic adaptor subunit [Pseudopedobacter saltans]|uniref:Efflux RND transporter periplasmic adaptor subunit n=1 Tax=Pseudopedobacter saltans TaxID=151895 RepID=A0A2W5FB25_9SPHI|nr:MAG: efflux RND transporter periplasmic adaptor subunit [Pseudopedobacter saltans]